MRKWVRLNLFQKKWNAKLINEFIEIEQIHISLLEKERLKGIESQQRGFAETQKFLGGNLVLGASKATERFDYFFKLIVCL